jgi:tetratricopeptide (TPR) repeat protein
MDRRLAVILTIWFVGEAVASPARTFPGKAAPSPTEKGQPRRYRPRLIAGMGSLHHPVSTKNAEAQEFFDQGLKLVYGFNHDEAKRSFERAAQLDPKLAMAWWGIALALGPNYNFSVEPAAEKAAFEAIQKAMALQENASEPERAYINALGFRYSNDPKADLHQLDAAYRDAMAKLVQRYPDDLDAATLYAGSVMNLNPWKLWSHDGQPNEGTEEILAVLESVLKRDPNHLGANHYYIHAVEPSPNPERALASAVRLETLAPAAGHLVHMPSHIYSRVGDYVASVRVNARAVMADRKFARYKPNVGVETSMLAVHNLHFLAYAYCMNGNFMEAKAIADTLVAQVQPYLKEMPMLEGFLPTPFLVLLAFECWTDLERLPEPDASLPVTNAVWHFARGVALANLGKIDLAEKEQVAWQQAAARVPNDTVIIELNTAGTIFKIHQYLLSAALARSRHDSKGSVDFLKQAVAAEDALNYSEPPAFYPPVRPLLGRGLLEMKKFSEAETVFRVDLEKNPRNSTSLAGLRDSLKAQKRDYEAALVDEQLRGPETAAATPRRQGRK